MTRTLTDLGDTDLGDLVEELGGKPFQARQLSHWLYRHGARTFDDCRNLPKRLREALAEIATLRGSEIARADRAADGTEKLLVRMVDGDCVETVIIPDGDRTTLCVSSQVGCPVACVFCASGLAGVRRNLTSGEIVEQVMHARDRLGPDRPLTNLVVMGMGEPLLNLDALLSAIERLTDPVGIGMGARRITVSTSGYPERMQRLSETPHQVQLAVSLHAADDALRRELVPTARASVRDIVDAAELYGEHKSREVTFEVVLLGGRNDRPRDADALVEVLGGVRATVNLIPWNPVDAIEGLARPDDARVDAFAEHLRRGGLKVTVRRQRGADRDAACGQLRLREAAGGAQA